MALQVCAIDPRALSLVRIAVDVRFIMTPGTCLPMLRQYSLIAGSGQRGSVETWHP